MSSTFSVGGLISGIDTETLIQQLVQLESAPVSRLEDRIAGLQAEQDAISGLRTTLLGLRNTLQDFQFDTVFNQFTSSSSEESVLTADVSSSNPVSGSYSIEVLQLASATSAVGSDVLGAPVAEFGAIEQSGIQTEVTAGTFTINGVEFNLNPVNTSFNTILTEISNSAAGVTATYDGATDRIVFANSDPNDTSIINFGSDDDTSNFLSAINITGATQYTNGDGSTEVVSTRNLGAIDPSAILNDESFKNGAVTAGTFQINGISITVDPTMDTISDVVGRINQSDADVTASYDASTDSIRVVSDNLGSRTIRFTSGTSNFLDVVSLTTAVQEAGTDAQFTVNGGAVQTRNSNDITGAVGGVSLTLLSEGTSTVTVGTDDDAVVEDIQEFVEEFNSAITAIENLVVTDGALESDNSIQVIQNYLLTNIFNRVQGIAGDFKSLVDIGITTGDAFDAETLSQLTLDEDAFRQALLDDRENVQNLFSNDDENGIADSIFNYLDEITGYSGFLNARSRSNGTIDQQIENLNDQIDRKEDQLGRYEERLRAQFLAMEQTMAQLQNSSSSFLGA